MMFYQSGIEALLDQVTRINLICYTNDDMEARRRVNDFLDQKGIEYDTLSLGLLIENAYFHGCGRNNNQIPQEYSFFAENSSNMVSIKALEGPDFILLRIRDPGQGFDVESTLGKYYSGEDYASNWGWGTKKIAHSDLPVLYEGGNIANVLFHKNEKKSLFDRAMSYLRK